jgi:hypothetical protein
MTVEKLAELFTEEWSASYSDSGYVWSKAKRELDAALDVVDEATKKAAFDLARARWPRA